MSFFAIKIYKIFYYWNSRSAKGVITSVHFLSMLGESMPTMTDFFRWAAHQLRSIALYLLRDLR